MSRHNLHGDIPLEHLSLAEELLEFEDYFESKLDTFEPSVIAKGFVCCAHDWYLIGDDEKGSELIKRASEILPGYFDHEMAIQIDQDENYRYLVENLTHLLLSIAKSIAEETR